MRSGRLKLQVYLATPRMGNLQWHPDSAQLPSQTEWTALKVQMVAPESLEQPAG